MRLLQRCAIVSTTALTVAPVIVLMASPVAEADCTDAGGITLCNDNTGDATTGFSGVWYPYPCEDDFTCVDGASVFGDTNNRADEIAPPPEPPGRPDIGLPGRPGDRPDRPDRPNRPSGGLGGGGGAGGGT